MNTPKKLITYMFGFLALALLFWTALSNETQAANQGSDDIQGPFVGERVEPGLSPAVRDLPTSVNEPTLNKEINPRHNPLLFEKDQGKRGTWDRVNVPLDPLIRPGDDNLGRTPGLDFSFEGTGNPTACGSCSPPDTNGDVGPNHYIQMVNATKVAIFDKSGTLLSGPFNLGTLWSSGVCTSNAGDPIVLYDPLADRWLLSQFAFPNHMCVAISQTADPTGSYHTYTFDVGAFPDYFKFGVWPDAYYMSANEASYTAYAFDRTNMLTGAAATFQKFTGGTNLYLPSDLDGATPPPAGAPNYFYTFKDASFHSLPTDRIEIRAFDVDWVTPANSTFTLVSSLDVTPFTYTVCGFFNLSCIRQLGTAQRVDAVSEWPMFRFPYRNFGTHQSLVGTFTVDGGTGEEGAAIRWFELRNTGGGWTLFQEGTFDPGDGHDRFMASIAMDRGGNIALGYSVSSSTMNPAIRYATRLASDPLGTMQAEAVLINGSGSQTGSNRWGDYSGMVVDPADDCTFWYTNEYYPTNASSTWKTRVGVFQIPECGESDFTLDVTPASQAICKPDDAVFAVNIGSIQGFSYPVTLSASGNPAGTTVGFSTNPVNPPGTSDMTVGNMGAAAAGSYGIEVLGVTPTKTHTTTVTLDVFAGVPGTPVLVNPPNGATGVDLSPTLQWMAVASAQSYDLEVATDGAFTNVVYSATGVTGTSHALMTTLDPSTVYFWRVRANNACGSGAYSAAFNFTTVSAPPILLVDDDDNSPDVQATYTSALDNLGMEYDIWDTANSDNEPDTSDLAAYQAVIWFTGYEFGGFTGPGSAGETALGTWLDNNNVCFFLSSQDYHYARGLTPFMTNYLGAASIVNDTGNYTSVTGQGSVFGGLGPYSLSYPFPDSSDIITPNVSAELAFQGDNANGAAVYKNSGTYQTTFWVFPWEAIGTSTGREASMQAFIVDACGITPPNIITGGTFDVITGPDSVVTQTLTISNTGIMPLDWTIDEDEGAVDLNSANPIIAPPPDSTGNRGGISDQTSPLKYLSPADFSEDFADITNLPGWYMQNNSDPIGVTNWFQGNNGVFPAHAGVPTAYIGANFNNTSGLGTISNWLLTPELSLSNGDTFSFWTRTVASSTYPDRLQVRLSTAGASTNVGTGAEDVGDFTILLEDINPTLVVGGYPEVWTQYTITLSGISNGSTGRFGFRYYVTDSGPSGSNGDYIGIDTVEYVSDFTCSLPTDIPWVSTSPSSGTTPGSSSSDVAVVFDSTGLSTGVYTGTLCINSNDPVTPLVTFPLTLTVDDNADLSLTKSAPASAIAGEPFTYTLEVTNAGPATALSTTVTDSLVAGVTFVSATAGCSETGGVVTCNLGALGSGATATVEIVVTANVTGLLTNTAAVASASPDPDTSDNSDSASTDVALATLYLPLIVKD